MTGQAERQPVEGVSTLDDLAGAMDASEVDTEELPEVEDEAGEAEVPEVEDESGESEESEDQDEAEDEQEEEPTVTLKHDGKEVTLKQSEAIELAQQGFDYTKKTMALAEDRKTVEAEKARVAEVRQRGEQALEETINRLNAYSQFMESQVGSPPHISLAQQDAARYLAEKELYEARRGQLQQANAEIARLTETRHQQWQARLQEEVQSTERTLRDTLPGWTDDTSTDLAKYMADNGLSLELNEVFVKPGLWEMAHKAKAYDALQAAKANLKPVNKLSKVQKPSATNQPVKRGELKRKEAEQKYHSNPSLDTLAGLIE